MSANEELFTKFDVDQDNASVDLKYKFKIPISPDPTPIDLKAEFETSTETATPLELISEFWVNEDPIDDEGVMSQAIDAATLQAIGVIS